MLDYVDNLLNGFLYSLVFFIGSCGIDCLLAFEKSHSS